MPVTRIPPQSPPAFTHTPDTVSSRTKALIEQSRGTSDGIAREITPETANFANVLKPLAEDEDEMALEGRILGFYQYVSANQELRDASSKADKELQEFGIEMSMREDIFKLVEAVYKSPSSNLDGESARFLEKSYKGYIRSGLSLPPEPERARFKEIQKRLSTLSIDFNKRLNEETGGLWFTPEELEGVPEDVISTLKKGEPGTENDGKYWLTYKYPDLFPTMKYAVNAGTRKKVFLGSENKCNDNAKLFKEAIVLRDEKARLLGFKNHAAFVLDEKMAKSPEKVMEFLTDLRTKLTPGGKEELRVLFDLKKADVESRGEAFDGRYYLWDHRFYDRLLLEKSYQLNAQKVAEYFPLQSTIDGMLRIFERLFGLEFIRVAERKDLEGVVWHEDAKLYQVWNEGENGGFVGWLYLDLHPRQGKYGHAANFNLQPGFTNKDGKRRYPATALVCNFSKPTKDKPSLLKHDEVTTLFHELGHGIHDLVSITHYSRFHGTAVVYDFVEAPSQMLENWCWTKEELTSLSSHYSTGEKIPPELVDKIIRTKHVNDAVFNLRQLHFAIFDMRVHNIHGPHEEVEKLDPQVQYNKLRKDISGIDGPEGPNDKPDSDSATRYGHGEATFSHLMGGYDAGYYGYLWSQVFSTDMFYTAFKKDPMNGEEGRRYRHAVLEKGGSQDEMETLKQFLGREPNNKAFLEDLGIAAK